MNQGIRGLTDRITKNEAAFKKAGVAFTAIAIGAAAPLIKGIVSFAKFEQAIARTGAIADATAEEMESLAMSARALGKSTQFSATEAANALTFLAQAGFDVQDATEALPGVLQLAAAANLDLATAADITTNVLTGYGFEVKDLTKVNDVLTKAFISANTDLTQLGQAMKFAGPVASAAGVRFEEAAAAISLMGNAGIQASMAGTSLRGAIVRLLNPSKEAEGILERLGITAVDAQGGLLPLVD